MFRKKTQFISFHTPHIQKNTSTMWKCCRRSTTKQEQYDEKGRLPIHDAALLDDVIALKRELDDAVPVDTLSRIVSPWATYPHVDRDGKPTPYGGISILVRQHSPLAFAVSADSHDAIKLLISHGAAVDQVDSHGNTPLHIACTIPGCAFGQRQEQTATILLQSGCNVDASGRAGFTALMAAVYVSNIRGVELLIRHKANRHAMDVHDRTALKIALEQVNRNDVIVDDLRQVVKDEKQFILDCILVHVDQVNDLSLLVYQYAYPNET